MPELEPASRVSLSGFGTFGLARSDNDQAQYVRDLSQPKGLTSDWSHKVDSVLGLQTNVKVFDNTDFVLQAISRYRYDGSFRPEISWAFIRHDFTPDIQARLGRLGTEFYMQADSRLVGFANTAMRPPPEFYGPLIFSYFDGIDLSGTLPLGPGLLRAKVFHGRLPEGSPFYENTKWKLDGSKLTGGFLDYFWGDWQVRVGRAEIEFGPNESPFDQVLSSKNVVMPAPIISLIPELSIVGKKATFDSIGVIFDRGALRINAMYGRINHETEAYEDSRSGFIIGSYRLGAFTPYLGYSRTKSTPVNITTDLTATFGPVLGPALVQGARDLTKGTHANQHTTTLGVRWDFYKNIALKVQLDEIRGASDSVFPYRGANPTWDGHMRIIGASLDFVF